MPDSTPTEHHRPRSRWRFLSLALSLAAVGVMIWLLHRYLTAMNWHQLGLAWTRLPPIRIVASLAAAGLSLSLLALFDVLAARIVAGERISPGRAAFAGAVTQAVSNTLGFHTITGAAVRYRIYHAAGLGTADIARIVALAGLGVGMGFVMAITVALCWEPAITHGWGRWPGGALALGLGLLLIWLSRRPRTLQLWHWSLTFPSAGNSALQMLIGTIEMGAAISALYLLLPADIAPSFIDFLPIYVGAVVAGLISHTPGGIGVFEAIMLAAFPAEARPELLASILCYRLTYYLLPFALGILALGGFELRQRRLRSTAPAPVQREKDPKSGGGIEAAR